MKRALLILLAAASFASGQTYLTVTADTNRVVRTNYSLVRSQISDLSGVTLAISNITALQTNLDGKLATNGSAAALTNFPASLLTTNGSAASLTNFPGSLLTTNGNANALTNFPASLLRTNGNAAGLTNFPTPSTASNVSGVVLITNGGTGTNTVGGARLNLLPSYTGNSNKVLAVSTNETDVLWVAQSGGSGGGDWWTNKPTTAVYFTTNIGTAGQVLALANATNLVWTDMTGGGSTTNTNGAIQIPSTNNVASYTGTNANYPVTIGFNATNAGRNIVIGPGANSTVSIYHDGVVIGRDAKQTINNGVTIGVSASTSSGSGSIAIGNTAVVTNTSSAKGIQIGVGTLTNSVEDSVQFFSFGNVNSTEWGYLASASARGGYGMTNTNSISGTKTFVAYDGTNYTTNSVTFSNGLITGWTP